MTPRAEAWLRQATSDFGVAELTASQGYHAQACYHAGQAAEKALRALLVASGATPPYSHSLPKLVEMLEQIGLDLGPLQDLQLKQLSRMASESRYPQAEEAPMDRFDAHDSTPALAMAGTVIAFASQTLNAPD
ncbi:MAG: HEPN domain-containing protein [Cyanobacteriota bacterium]|nr:HEPN domain-containing protein [Cyanobacteriota bacterium]